MKRKSFSQTFTLKSQTIRTVTRKILKLRSWCWISASRLTRNTRRPSSCCLLCIWGRETCRNANRLQTFCWKSTQKMIRLGRFWHKFCWRKTSTPKPLSSLKRCWKTNPTNTPFWPNLSTSSGETINYLRPNITSKQPRTKPATPTTQACVFAEVSTINTPEIPPKP